MNYILFILDMLLGILVLIGTKSRRIFTALFGLFFWPTFLFSGLYLGTLEAISEFGFLKNNIDSMWIYVFGTILFLMGLGVLFGWVLTRSRNLDAGTRNTRLMFFIPTYLLGAIITIGFTIFMTLASGLSGTPGY